MESIFTWWSTPIIVALVVFLIVGLDALIDSYKSDTEKQILIHDWCEMKRVLRKARKAISDAPDDAFSYSEYNVGDGKIIKYPRKDELLNEIDEVLK